MAIAARVATFNRMHFLKRLTMLTLLASAASPLSAAEALPDLDDRDIVLRADLIGGLAMGSGPFIANQLPEAQPPLFGGGFGASVDFFWNVGVESYLGPRLSVGLDFGRRGYSMVGENGTGSFSTLAFRMPLLVGFQFLVIQMSVGVAPEFRLGNSYTEVDTPGFTVPVDLGFFNLPLMVRIGALIPVTESFQVRFDLDVVNDTIAFVGDPATPDDTFQLLDLLLRVGVGWRFGFKDSDAVSL